MDAGVNAKDANTRCYPSCTLRHSWQGIFGHSSGVQAMECGDTLADPHLCNSDDNITHASHSSRSAIHTGPDMGSHVCNLHTVIFITAKTLCMQVLPCTEVVVL